MHLCTRVLWALFLAVGLAACAPEGAPLLDGDTSSEALGRAAVAATPRLFSRCETATRIGGVWWRYRTSWIHPSSFEARVEVVRGTTSQGTLVLTRDEAGVWSSERASLELVPRVARDGGWMLAPRVVHHVPGARVEASAANGFCTTSPTPLCTEYEIGICSGGPRDEAMCRCIATGAAPHDPIGQAALNALLGGPLRLLVQGLLARLAEGAARWVAIGVGTAAIAVLLGGSSADTDEGDAALSLAVERELARRDAGTIEWLRSLPVGAVARLGARPRPSIGELMSAVQARGQPVALVRTSDGADAMVIGLLPPRVSPRMIGSSSDPGRSLADALVISEQDSRGRAATVVIPEREIAALLLR